MFLRSILKLVIVTTAVTASGLALAQPAEVPAVSGLVVKTQVINPEDLLDSNRTVVVPTAYVSMLTDGRVAATKQSGFFQSGKGTAKASASYRVTGLDKAFMQQLAQAAYDDFVTQLRAAGYTVLTYADVRDRDFMQAADRQTEVGALGLPTRSEGGNNYAIAAPSDEQHFASSFAGGDLAEFLSGGKSRFTDATLIIPQYTFVAPQAWTDSSSGYKSVSAEANVAEGMNLQSARATWVGQPKSRMMRGIPGVATTEQVINVTEKAGTLAQTADTTPDTANAVSQVLNVFGGGGTIKKSSGEYELVIDPEAYRNGLLNGVRAFNSEVAKAAAAAKSE
jgi:hypothetical protein